MSRRAVYGYALLLCVASCALTGYRLYVGNHSLQIPLLHVLADPSVYAGDPFAATLPLHGSVLWRAVAAGARHVSLDHLLIAGFVLERFFLIVGAAFLAGSLVPGSRLAVVGVMAVFALAPAPVVGSGTLVAPYFEQTGLAIVCCLFAAAALYSRRPIAWAIGFAAGCDLNSFYGVYFATYSAGTLVVDATYRPAWRGWLIAAALGVAIASPEIAAGLATIGRGSGDEALWIAASRTRFASHLMPLSWGAIPFAEYLALTLVTLGVVRLRGGWDARLSLRAAIWTAVSGGWLVFAFVAAFLVDQPWALVLHPARGTDPWTCFAAAALTASSARLVERAKPEGRRWPAVLLLGSILFWLPTPWFVGCAIVLAVVVAWRPAGDGVLDGGSARRAAVAVVSLVLVSGAIAAGTRGAIVIEPRGPRVDLARWARRNTPSRATFLVDPSWQEFRPSVQVPMMGGGARLGRWFIDRGMRKNTPKAMHERVVTVDSGIGAWKARVGFAGPDDAYLLVLDTEGCVRWRGTGARAVDEAAC